MFSQAKSNLQINLDIYKSNKHYMKKSTLQHAKPQAKRFKVLRLEFPFPKVPVPHHSKKLDGTQLKDRCFLSTENFIAEHQRAERHRAPPCGLRAFVDIPNLKLERKVAQLVELQAYQLTDVA